MSYPPCFDSQQQFDAWEKAANDPSLEHTHKPTYCSDCLPDFKRRMLSQGRCIHPEVTFHQNGPQAYYGRRPHYAIKKENH